ncbi:MAG: hypothetical protein ACTSWP_04405 [Candidatus Freyarchaeota archaeon]
MWWKNEASKGVVLKHAKDVWLSSLSKIFYRAVIGMIPPWKVQMRRGVGLPRMRVRVMTCPR